MISVCMLVNKENLSLILDQLYDVMPCEWELVIGDCSNGKREKELKLIADEYIKISPKQSFKMGIPFCHNLVSSVANSYKIIYLDADEIPVWINPDIENLLEKEFWLISERHDFVEEEDIIKIAKTTFEEMRESCKTTGAKPSIQPRIYNSRYVQFTGIIHSWFEHPTENNPKHLGAILLHNVTERNKKRSVDAARFDDLVHEQYARQNMNPKLAVNSTVLSWGKKWDHEYKDWKEWYNKYC